MTLDFTRLFYDKVHAYLLLLRPFTLLAPIIVSSCVMIASLFSLGTTKLNFEIIVYIIFPASLCFALLNGASNSLNQATDLKEDKISKPYRPLPKGLLSVNEAFAISFILYTIAIIVSFVINPFFCLFVLFIALFSISYSVPPRMKKYLCINQIWVAIPRGMLGILGSWSVFDNPFQPLPLAIGFIAALFLFGGTATKDILDKNADKDVGTKTLINVFGLQKTACISVVFMTIAFLLVIPMVFFNIIAGYLLPLTGLSILSLIIYGVMIHDHKNDTCENTRAWSLMYGTYFLFSISFAGLTIMNALY